MTASASASLPAPLVDPRIGQSLIEASSAGQFAAALLGAARRFDVIDEVFAYQIDSAGGVRMLLATGERRGLDKRTDAYARRFHAQDPLLRQRAVQERPGGFTRRVRAADIPPGEYRALCFDAPGFVDKLSFGWRTPESVMVLSFYRGVQARGACAGPLGALGQLAMSALGAHAWTGATPAPGADALHVLRQRLERSYPRLSGREREIVALTLLGDSAAEIARALSIRPATVLTYRQRAYERYRFGRASDFLAGLLH